VVRDVGNAIVTGEPAALCAWTNGDSVCPGLTVVAEIGTERLPVLCDTVAPTAFNAVAEAVVLSFHASLRSALVGFAIQSHNLKY